MNKFASRKFWICVAAFLASISTSITGLVYNNQTLAIVGTIAGVLSAAIYAAIEAALDAKKMDSDEDM